MTTTAERLAEVIAGAAADLQAGKSIDRHNDSLRRLIAELGRGSGELGVTALELAISGTVPLGTVLPAMLGVHTLIGIGEAVITVAAVSAVMSTRPDVVRALPQGALA